MGHHFQDFAVVPLSKSCFPPRAGSISWKNDGFVVKKGAGSMNGAKKIVDRIRNLQN